MNERIEPSTPVPPIHDVWTHRFNDHRPRRLTHNGQPIDGRTAHLGPLEDLPGTRLTLLLSEDGESMQVERIQPKGCPKNPAAVASALRRAAWALDQDLPNAPALFLDAFCTERLHLTAVNVPTRARRPVVSSSTSR